MNLKNEISSFFNNVLEAGVNPKFKDDLSKSEEYKQSRNILYLTNQCNIKCDYCYQLKDRESSSKHFISNEEIDSYFNNLVEREPNQTSVVVLFGGEPFLNYSKMEYIFDLTDKITTSSGKRFNLSTITNGTWFLNENNVNKFLERISNLKNTFLLEVSYDGTGHDRRKYSNGESTKEDVKSVIKLLMNRIKLSIRYTIHKDNYKDCFKDFIQLSKLPIYRIFVNFYEQELDLYTDVSELKKDLKSKTNDLFKVFQKSICHLNCDECKGCNFSEFSDNIHYGLGKNEFIVKTEKAKKFNHFTEKFTENFTEKFKGENTK